MKKVFSATKYKIKNKRKASIITKAVKRGVKEYGETFKKLAFT